MTEDRAYAEAARRALRAAFGSPQVLDLSPIGGGASGAFPFRAEIDPKHYLVRVEGPASPLRNPHQYVSMRIAAEAGIAPPLHYVDETNRVAVMDFIEEQPLSAFPGGPMALATAIGALLRGVQQTSLFPVFVSYPDIVSRLWAWVCQTGLFADGALAPYSERLAELCRLHSPGRLVSSHNDLVPRNVLFDGARLWLIDWESAYRNDPLVDLSIALDNFAPTPDLAHALLEAWNGSAPDGALLLARLEVARGLSRLYYAGVLLSAAAALGPLSDGDLSVPTRAEFDGAVSSGRLVRGSPETKLMLGKMYLASFMTGDAPPGLDAAV